MYKVVVRAVVGGRRGAVVRFVSLVPMCVHDGVRRGVRRRQFVGFALRARV
jgi:hypothetical protein